MPEAPPAVVPSPEEAAAAIAAADEAKHQSWLDTLDPPVANEIRRLRDESAGYRTKLRTYEDPFSAYNDEQRETWFELVQGLANDPQAGAKALMEVAQRILTPEEAADANAAAAGIQQGGEQTASYVTPEVLEAKLTEREQKAALNQERERIQSEAKAAGYEPGSERYYRLLYLAQQHQGDLKKADEAIKAADQAIIDAYVAGKRADAAGSISPVQGGGAPGESQDVKDFAAARRSLEARLNQI